MTIEIETRKDGRPIHYRKINEQIRNAIDEGEDHIVLKNVCGQRFIGAGIKADATIEVYGDAGLDLGVFSDGLSIKVHGNSEYLLGNTLNSGELVVYGDSWDITGMGARGGNMFIMGDGGSRIGIHMKQFKDKRPAIVYGGTVKQYCGEYMAGGTIVVLGLDYSDAVDEKKNQIDAQDIDPEKIKDHDEPIVQSDLGGGIHGGAIYVRGQIPESYLGVYASKESLNEEDKKILEPLLRRYSELFNTPKDLLWSKEFTKVVPVSSRPFGKVYTKQPI